MTTICRTHGVTHAEKARVTVDGKRRLMTVCSRCATIRRWTKRKHEEAMEAAQAFTTRHRRMKMPHEPYDLPKRPKKAA